MAKEPKDKEKTNNQPEGENVEQAMVALTFDEYDALEKKIEGLEKEAEEAKDSWLRSRADFENYKKRVARDAERSYQDAKANIIKMFLGASDDLERALAHRPQIDDGDGWEEEAGAPQNGPRVAPSAIALKVKSAKLPATGPAGETGDAPEELP